MNELHVRGIVIYLIVSTHFDGIALLDICQGIVAVVTRNSWKKMCCRRQVSVKPICIIENIDFEDELHLLFYILKINYTEVHKKRIIEILRYF